MRKESGGKREIERGKKEFKSCLCILLYTIYDCVGEETAATSVDDLGEQKCRIPGDRHHGAR